MEREALEERLSSAAERGHFDEALALLNEGASPNGTATSRPLCRAVLAKHKQLVWCLVEAKADLELPEKHTPLQLAVMKGAASLLSLIKQPY